MPIQLLPTGLIRFAERGPDWAGWLDRLPKLVHALVSEWELRRDGDPTHGETALVQPVTTTNGEPAVLKIVFPHPEAAQEHLALQTWGGVGAVRLLRADPHRYALLLERVSRRDLTDECDIAACKIVARLYRQLHQPAGPRFPTLSGQIGQLGDDLKRIPRSAPLPHRMVEHAIGLCRSFAADPATEGTLIHTDLHYRNVLAAERAPWLVIDPKPVSGDPGYEVAPLLWNRWPEVLATGDVRQAVRARFHAVVDVAGLDEDRTRDWVIVRELAVAALPLGQDRALTGTDRDWITRHLAIAKAVQE